MELNDEKISLAEFQKYLEQEKWKFGSGTPLPIQNILDAFLKDRMLLQEAKKRNVPVSSLEVNQAVETFKRQYARKEDFEKMLALRGWTFKDFSERRRDELLIQKLVDQMTQELLLLEDKDLKEYYEKHLEEFSHPEQVRSRQIVTDTKEKALALLELLQKGTPFEEVALKYSLSPDRKKGGDLGWFERGIMPKAFDEVCFSLEIGRLSPVVRTPYGFHIFEVLEKRGAGRTSFEEVKDKIQMKLRVLKGKEFFGQWYQELSRKAKIKVYANILEQIH